MPLSFSALDEEFAAATGRNITNYDNTSAFDDPPSSFTNLVVSSNEGDVDPRLFEEGDTYDLTWTGPDGARTMEDAVVVRSDAAPGQGGIIVLEGPDENGDLTQIIWTPDFNLEEWYDDHNSSRSNPQFYTSDRQPDYDHKFVCFAAETAIFGPGGTRPAGQIKPGDLVMTLDSGMQPVLWAGHQTVPGYGAAAPVLFDPGAFGNDAPLRLSQQHRVLYRSALADIHFGSSEVLIPAKALVDECTVHIAPCRSVTYVHLLLDMHSVLFAEGAPCESLLLGTQALQALDGDMQAELTALLPQAMSDNPGRHVRSARPILTVREAQMLRGLHMPAGVPSSGMARL